MERRARIRGGKIMKALLMTLAVAAFVLPLNVGCSRTVSQQESTTQNPITGTETHQESTVKQNPDGSYTTEKQVEKYPQ
jgi:hypothetical protein